MARLTRVAFAPSAARQTTVSAIDSETVIQRRRFAVCFTESSFNSGGSMRSIGTVVAILLLLAHGGAIQRAADDASVNRFTIHVADADLADLKARLARARFPDEIPGSDWTYGTSRAYLESL